MSTAVAAIRAELADETWPERTVLGVLFESDERIAELNAEWRGKPTPTNVLSWPAEEIAVGEAPGAYLGDLAFAGGVVEREASECGWAFGDYLVHLTVHGALHCLGYDHVEEAEGDTMEAAESRILARLGLPDPYAE